MATLEELKAQLITTHKSGDTERAGLIANLIKQEMQARAEDPYIALWEQVPDNEPRQVPGSEALEPQPDQSQRRYGDELVQKVADEVIGAGEAALTMGTGMTAGTVGHIGGTLKGIAEQLINVGQGGKWDPYAVKASAEKEQGKLTYQPRTEEGQRDVQAIAETLQPLTAIGPLSQTQTMAQAAALSGPQLRQGVMQAGQATRAGAKQLQQGAKQLIAPRQTQALGGGKSAGSAGVDPGVLRQAKADELGVGLKLTKGQRTRNFEQQRFEHETAKIGDIGEPLRQRGLEQNQQLQLALDKFIDKTGTKLGDDPGTLRIIGEQVDDVLLNKLQKTKNKVNVLYKKARDAGEMQEPVDLQKFVDYVNENVSLEGTAPILGVARKELLRLKFAAEDADGNLVLTAKGQGAFPRKMSKSQLAAKKQPVDLQSQIIDDGDTLVLARGGKVNKDSPNFFSSTVDIADDYADGGKLGLYQINGKKVPQLFEEKVWKLFTPDEQGQLEFMGVDAITDPPAWLLNKIERAGYDGYRSGQFTRVNKPSAIVKEVTPRSGKPLPSVGKGPNINDTELLRKKIGDATNSANAVDVRQSSIMKSIIDEVTEGKGGELYKQARKARAKMGNEFERSTLVKKLMSTKPGTNDRTVAYENVVQKVMLDPNTSIDELRALRRTLMTGTGGPEGSGAQAWRELQAETLRHIKRQALKNVARNELGDEIMSAKQLDNVIKQLDSKGKMDYMFGPKQADLLRMTNEVTKDLLVDVPNTANNSQTASVLIAAMMDVAISGSAGVPAPLMSSIRLATSAIKNSKLKTRVLDALK